MGLGGTMAVQALSRRSLLAGAVSGFAFPARAQPVVSTALVLAADISSSVNRERFELQRKGYADTFTDAQVIRAIRDTAHGCIGICYFEWAGGNRWAGGDSQRVLVPWTLVQSVEDGERIAAVLNRAPRPFDGSTDLGAAIRFAGIRCRSNRWQRLRIVGRTFCGSVVAKMNFTCSGGSSSVFKSALKAAADSMWTSSIR